MEPAYWIKYIKTIKWFRKIIKYLKEIPVSYNIKRLSELFKCIYEHTTDIFGDITKNRRTKFVIGAGSKIMLTNERGTVDLNDLELFIKNFIIKPICSQILTWEIYIPLDNLYIEQELKLGDVSFVTKDYASTVINDFREKGDFRLHGKTEEEKENNKKALDVVTW